MVAGLDHLRHAHRAVLNAEPPELLALELRLALEELEFFSREVRIMGVYPAHPFRFREPAAAD